MIAFISLGFLIGNLAGLSANNVTNSLIALLFAFAGGSAIAFLSKLERPDRTLAGQAITALSIGCLLGTYGGVLVAEYQVLTPPAYRQAPADSSVGTRKLLRAELKSQASVIDQMYKGGQLSLDQAYELLREQLIKADKQITDDSEEP